MTKKEKERIFDRGILFLKRLEDDGANVHINAEDKDLLKIYTSQEANMAAKELEKAIKIDLTDGKPVVKKDDDDIDVSNLSNFTKAKKRIASSIT